jgi:hypothetical protein
MSRSLESVFVALIVIAFAATTAGAQSVSNPAPKDEDHAVVYELGWAGDYSRDEGVHAKGATFAFEVTPIPDRLELEVGVTAIRANGVTESSVDLLFKKPWTLSKHVENVGVYVEPGYEVDFRAATTRQGFAMAAGLIIGR